MPSATRSGNAMKFPVDQILNLPEMKVLDCQEIEGMGIVITIEKSVNYSTCPSCEQIRVRASQTLLTISNSKFKF
jgi:transposase